jgi:hypothetical protein
MAAARFFRVACWVPLITCLVVVGFAAMAWHRVGHWPVYGRPDPKDLNLPWLHGAALISFPLAVVAIPLSLFVVICDYRSLERRDVVVFTAGTAGWAFLFPTMGKLFEWLID